jgi:methylated-DNA-protein-cysteine methyltransferase-like protein
MTTFSERVVRLALSIPKGRVTTYGRIARAAGAGPMAAQSITSILAKARAKDGADIPFHRIVYANGRVWMHPRDKKKRAELYKKEGIVVDRKGRVENFADIVFDFA